MGMGLSGGSGGCIIGPLLYVFYVFWSCLLSPIPSPKAFRRAEASGSESMTIVNAVRSLSGKQEKQPLFEES
jgi:hypothetical protein